MSGKKGLQSEAAEQFEVLWAYLVMGVLSVNHYPLHKTFLLFDQLKAEGLFRPSNLASLSLDEIARRLAVTLIVLLHLLPGAVHAED